MRVINSGFGNGGSGLTDQLPGILRELQSLTTKIVAGVGAATNVAVPGMLAGATVQSVTMFTAGVPSTPTPFAGGNFISITGNIKLTEASTGNQLVVNYFNK